MRHEYLSVYNLDVESLSVGGGSLVTKEHNFATDGHISGTYDLFTITGTVRVKLLAICNTNLAGGGAGSQITLGFSGATTALIAQTTATGVDAGEIWSTSTIASNLRFLATTGIFDRIVTGPGSPIQMVITSASTSTGKITFYCWWEPITSGAIVAAA